MNAARTHRILLVAIASVWLVNGLYCKTLNFVPRHQMIVARVLGAEHAGWITRTIGVLEVCMALWVLSGILPRLCAYAQGAIVASMNVLEYLLARDLLLFGRGNAVFATCFVLVAIGAGEATTRMRRRDTAPVPRNPDSAISP